MKTLYATPSAAFNWPKLREEAEAIWADCEGVSLIDDGAQIAVYLADTNPATTQDWQGVVDAHNAEELTNDQQLAQDVQAADVAATTEALSPALKSWLAKDKDTFVADALALSDTQFKAMAATAIWMIIHASFGKLIAMIKRGLA